MRHPDVPETLDGWYILHRMFALDRRALMAEPAERRRHIVSDAIRTLEGLHASADGDCALAAIIGHKADLMFTHYARTFEGLLEAQTAVDQLELSEFLSPQASYVSLLELGLYDATAKIHDELREGGLKPHSGEWNEAFDAAIAEQARAPRNATRLWAKVPARRYACFYPMDKKRGESVNWYALPYTERVALMLEHGKIGRSFHGLVTQVISGSIGFDDWEWGVDLYADDPAVFKKLVYEMRFDEASAKYAAFGPFHTGVQFSIPELGRYLEGAHVPALHVEPAPQPALR